MMSVLSRSRAAQRPGGLTLVELLVALAVISLLAGVALPTVKNTLRSQRISRAASLLKSAIEDGRARSIVAGGGGGIIIDRRGKRSIAARSESIQIRLATTPAPYTGDVGNATAKVGVQTVQAPNTDLTDDVITLWFDPSAAQIIRSAQDIANGRFPTLINIGDLVRIGDAGLPLTISRISFGTVAARNAAGLLSTDIPDLIVTSWVRVEVTRSEPNLDLARFIGQDVSFSITRAPRPAIAMPVALPKGAVIDLTASGLGRFGNDFSPMEISDVDLDGFGNYTDTTILPYTSGPVDFQSIYILFGARGEVSRVLAAQLVAGVPQLSELTLTGDIHLLVGRAGEVKTAPEELLEENDTDPFGDEAKDGTTPLLDPESIWLTIRVRNGEVVTTPWIDPTDQSVPMIPPQVGPVTDQSRSARIQAVIGLSRSASVESQDVGSI